MSKNQDNPDPGQASGPAVPGPDKDKAGATPSSEQEDRDQTAIEAFDEEGAGIAPKE